MADGAQTGLKFGRGGPRENFPQERLHLVDDPRRFAVCITFDDTLARPAMSGNPDAGKGGAVQHRGVSAAMPDDDRTVRGDGVQVVPGRVTPLPQAELVVAVAADPVIAVCPGATRAERIADVGDRARPTQIGSVRAACPGEQVEMRIDESR